MTTRPAARASSEEHLLDTALAVLLEFGLRRTRMEDLARHAGISRATLYRQFRDRTALIQAVIMRESRRSLASIQRHLDDIPEAQWGREGLFQVIRTAVRHPLMERLLKVDADYLLPVLTVDSAETLKWAQGYVTALVTLTQQRGLLPAGQAAEVAELLLRLLHSWLLTPAAGVDVRDDRELRQYIDGFLWPLLANRQPAPLHGDSHETQ